MKAQADISMSRDASCLCFVPLLRTRMASSHIMNMLLLLFALCFPLVASAAAPCAVSEKDLVGSWVQKGANGPFEQMMFEVDGGDRVFSSWLHDRPEIAGGRWKLENCLLLVNHPAEKGLAWQFNVTKTKNGQLQVQEPGEKKPAIYRRIKE